MTPARILQLERLGLLRARPRHSRVRHNPPSGAPTSSPVSAIPAPPPPETKPPLPVAVVDSPAASGWWTRAISFGSSQLDRIGVSSSTSPAPNRRDKGEW
jgi:hypothetical protein